jgi:hypothetical protein
MRFDKTSSVEVFSILDASPGCGVIILGAEELTFFSPATNQARWHQHRLGMETRPKTFLQKSIKRDEIL